MDLFADTDLSVSLYVGIVFFVWFILFIIYCGGQER
jgi:hypothetical protein